MDRCTAAAAAARTPRLIFAVCWSVGGGDEAEGTGQEEGGIEGSGEESRRIHVLTHVHMLPPDILPQRAGLVIKGGDALLEVFVGAGCGSKAHAEGG